MSKKIAPIPKGYRTVTPELVVSDAGAALAYYQQVFLATELSQITADDGVTLLRTDLKIGNSIVRIIGALPAFGILSPIEFGGTAVAIHIYDVEADEVWERAMANGAGILVPFADTPWGERYGKFADPFGHVWSVSRRIAKVASQPAVADTAADASSSAAAFSVHEPRADRLDPTVEQEVVLMSEGVVKTHAA